jgi:hypothetical protein
MPTSAWATRLRFQPPPRRRPRCSRRARGLGRGPVRALPGTSTKCGGGRPSRGIAASVGTTAERLAELNGLDPDDTLLEGTVLTLGGPNHGRDVGRLERLYWGLPPSDDLVATPGRVSHEEIAQIAQNHGVPPSLPPQWPGRRAASTTGWSLAPGRPSRWARSITPACTFSRAETPSSW